MMGLIMERKTVVVYVNLLNEGTPTIRPTDAEVAGEGLYKLLPTERYDPENEEWEFLPGSIVLCQKVWTDDWKRVLLAVKQVE
jgi:hypothetical protein